MKHKSNSIAQKVFRLLDADPHIKQALRLEIANHSAIAKKLKKEHLPKASIASLKAAIRRYDDKMEFYDYKKDLKYLIHKTRISMKSDIGVLFVLPTYDAYASIQKLPQMLRKDFNIITSQNGITIILDEDKMNDVIQAVGKKNVIDKIKGLYAIALTAPFEELEQTPGYVAFFTELLAREGINIRDYYSCYSDTVFVMEKKEAMQAYKILDRVLSTYAG